VLVKVFESNVIRNRKAWQVAQILSVLTQALDLPRASSQERHFVAVPGKQYRKRSPPTARP
jgi:hypothetical protein